MNGKDDIMKAIEFQRQFQKYLLLRYTKIIETMLSEDSCTINEISRILKLNGRERNRLCIAMHRLKFLGRVRKYFGRFELIRE